MKMPLKFMMAILIRLFMVLLKIDLVKLERCKAMRRIEFEKI